MAGFLGKGRVLKVGDEIAGIKIVRIKYGTNGKVAIIGRDMSNVRIVANDLIKKGYSVEILDDAYLAGYKFNIGGENWTVKDAFDDLLHNTVYKRDVKGFVIDSDIPNTIMYKVNEQWIKIDQKEYSVVDIGSPFGAAKSVFYDMEIKSINW